MMYFFIERMNNAKNSVINNEETNAFDEIYQNTLIEFYNKYELPPLHEYGDGFTKGDASNEECDTLVAKGLAAKEDEGSYTFAELDKLFCDAIEIAVEKYNDNYLEEKLEWFENNEPSLVDDFNMTAREDIIDYIIDNIE